METKNHFSLSLHLIRKDKGLIRHKLAFLLGSIMPDINLLTYFRGHTFEESIDDNRRELERLMSKQRLSLRDTYRLGKVIHYVGDYFTFPHNRAFRGGLYRHYRYEKVFSRAFSGYLKTLPGGEYESIGYTTGRQLTGLLEESHAEYLSHRMSMADDCMCIIAACTYVTQAVCAQRLLTGTPLPLLRMGSAPMLTPGKYRLKQKS